MKKVSPSLSIVLATLLVALPLFAGDFRLDSQITQLAGEVATLPKGGTEHPAQVDETIVVGDVLKTGASSRAELTSADTTVIRVGANSIFSFSEQSRQMILQQGSMLFHTPHGEGGGVIKTAAVTAAVTGSTVALCTTSNGGAKIIPLESPCTITGPDGRAIATIKPGQLLALFPGSKPIVVSINLAAFTKSSGLIKGFAKPLSKLVTSQIDKNANNQDIASTTQQFLIDGYTVTVDNPLPNPNNILTTATPTLQLGDIAVMPNVFKTYPHNLYALFPTPSSASTDPLASIARQNGVATPSSYFAGGSGAYSDATLATVGISRALPSSFNLASFTSGATLLGSNLSFLGNPSSVGYSVDLSTYSSSGLFSFVALGNVTFQPRAGSGTDYLVLSNCPQYTTIGAAGTFSLESSGVLSMSADAANLSLASVGPMSFANLYLTNAGNLYLGTLSDLTTSSSSLIASNGELSLFSGGAVNFNGTANYLNAGTDITVVAAKNLNINGAVYTGQYNSGPTGTVSFISNLGDININNYLEIYDAGSVYVDAATGSLNVAPTSPSLFIANVPGSVTVAATTDINFAGPVFLNNLAGDVLLTAGRNLSVTGSLNINTDSSVTANSLTMTAGSNLTLDGSTLGINLGGTSSAYMGSATLSSGPTINAINLEATNGKFDSLGNVTIASSGDLKINYAATCNFDSVDPSDSLYLSGNNVTVNSLADYADTAPTGSSQLGIATIVAQNLISLTGGANNPIHFNNYSTINMMAYTIFLKNVNFGSATVNLTSSFQSGYPYTASASAYLSPTPIPGKVAFDGAINGITLTGSGGFVTNLPSNIHVYQAYPYAP